MCEEIIEQLKELSEPAFADWFRPFISLNKESSEIVLGIRVPKLRRLASYYKNLSFHELEGLLKSNIHEAKALSVFVLLKQVRKNAQKVCDFYLANLEYINNWDLVDYSAPHIVAPNITEQKLRELFNSDYLWANRVAMVSTIYFIKQKDFRLALEFAEKYISHPHHLMHKAAGWMLREIGKQDEKVLVDFLNKFSAQMPSVMRSYAKEILRKKRLI